MSKNQTLIQYGHGVVPLSGFDNSWAVAIDAVDYPVNIVNAYYQDKDGEFVSANGETNTGRDRDFYLVLVDKLRSGQLTPISCVTGRYGTMATASVYEDMREALNDLDDEYELTELYVSGTGGMQELSLEFHNRSAMIAGDSVTLVVTLHTSVDGTKAHTLSISGKSDQGYSLPLYNGQKKLKARHTQTVADRTVNFTPAITDVIKAWDSKVVPMLKLMNDQEYDQDKAIAVVERMAEKAKMGKRHTSKVVELYKSDQVRTNQSNHNLYRVMATFGQYIDDELEEKKELQSRFREGLVKAQQTELKK